MLDRAALLALLGETPTLTLATINPDGTPRATPLYFAYDLELSLYFLSDPSSQHCLNLKQDGRAAAALYPASSDWRELRGLQLQGRVTVLEGSRRQQALDLYRARFPFLAELEAAVRASGLYCFTPTWVRLIDNRRGFGHQQEWTLA
ncbi:MAG: pyridoxamine 5'-phosphate oxidase family protein [Chloroflexota bacterium]